MITTILCYILTSAACSVPSAPQNLRITFGEKSLDIFWDSLPGTVGYNVYSRPERNAPTSKRRRLNRNLITSGAHFTYIWEFEGGKRIRKVKGHRHVISVTALCVDNGDTVESDFSAEIDNFYFEGYENIITEKDIRSLLQEKQKISPLPITTISNGINEFVAFMIGPAQSFHALVKDTIDPLEVGACSPISTILVKLLSECGIEAYKVEGTFIREYHAFVVINIEGVEYVLDFTADQYIPGVTPVMIPRDYCFLDSLGDLSTSGTPIYEIQKIYRPEQTDIVDTDSSSIYRSLLSSALSDTINCAR
jgi:hypothetical protein